MPDNQGLSHLSDHFLIVAVVLYSLAVVAFAADFAFGRRSPVVSRARAGVHHRIPAAAAVPVPLTAAPGRQRRWQRAADSGAPGSGAGQRRGDNAASGRAADSGGPVRPMP
jgi:hypothetical protein